MKLIALHTIRGLKEDGEYTVAGEAFEVDKEEGQRLIDLGAAREEVEGEDEEPPIVGPSETENLEVAQQAAAARAAVLAHIASAATVETLKMVADRIPAKDQELTEAYEARLAELAQA